LTRKKRPQATPIDATDQQIASAPEQFRDLEHSEMKDRLWQAIDSLPQRERESIALFYISGYSTTELSEFLNVNIPVVKKRLHSARNRLRDLLLGEVEDLLHSQRPSRDQSFITQTVDLIQAARIGDSAAVKRLLKQNPRLAAARDPMGNTALVVAANSGHHALAEMLIGRGVRPDFFEAAAMGRTELVEEFLLNDPGLTGAFSPEGFTALCLAAHFGHEDAALMLIEAGAGLDVVSRHPLEVTPLLAALYGAALLGNRLSTAQLLIERGTNVNARRGGKGWPRSGWSALHYCAAYGFVDLVDALVSHGSEIDCRDDDEKTPLGVAIETGHSQIAQLLREFDAKE